MWNNFKGKFIRKDWIEKDWKNSSKRDTRRLKGHDLRIPKDHLVEKNFECLKKNLGGG